MFANNFFPMLITVGAVLVISATYSPWLTLLLIAIYPVFTWLTAITSKRWQELEREKNVHFDIAGGRFAEVVGQIKVVKSFGQQPRELSHFAEQYDRSVELTRVQSRWWHLMDVARRGALNLIFFAIYLIIFVQTVQGNFTVGQLVLLVQLVAMARQPVMGMSFLVDSLQKAITGSRDFFDVLAEPEEELTHGPAAGPARAAVSGAPAIQFDRVGFGYAGGEIVLNDVSFDVRPGERIAFVGESGGGKTTLVSLLLGLYRPDSGDIRVGGRGIADLGLADLRVWTDPPDLLTRLGQADLVLSAAGGTLAELAYLGLADLRAQVGVVFQEASLFSGTIAENIRYGRPEATLDEVIEAARRANAHDFISGFAKGYDAEIGERGLKLSGGQKQRIAVARAMLKDAPILVLDEATSSLDSKSERLVQQGLEHLMADRTTLIVAHRLSTISSVDRIVTLRDGRVDEIGSPAELARSGGIYAELLALQSSASKADRKRLQEFDILR